MSNPEIGKTMVAAGITTNYHDMGEGEPVVMIHGSGPGVTAWANWRLNMPVLAERFRVIAADIIGFGYSGRAVGEPYSKALWRRHLIGVLDQLGLDKVDLVGNSFGGALALSIAAEHPDRVRRLVLMGAAGIDFELTPGLDMAWGYEPSLENMKKLLEVFAYDRSRVTDELAELRYKAAAREGVQEAFAAMFPAPRQDGIRGLATPEDQIRALPHKTLIVHGREDRVIPPSNATRFFDLISDAELHMFGRCGHWTQIEHAARFNQLVADFLAA